jgi:hypothetical protein
MFNSSLIFTRRCTTANVLEETPMKGTGMSEILDQWRKLILLAYIQ